MANRSFLLCWVLLLLCALIWGSSFHANVLGMLAFSPYQMSSLSMAISSLLFIPFFRKHYKKVKKKQDLAWIFLLYLCNTFFPYYLFCVAQTNIDAATAAVLNAFTPIWALLIGIFFFKHRSNIYQWLGVLLGFLSFLLIVFSEHEIKSSSFFHCFLVLLATLCYGLAGWIIQKKIAHLGAMTMTVLGQCFLGAMAIVLFFLMEDFTTPFHHPQVMTSLYAILFLAFLATALAGLLFNMVIIRGGAMFASMVTYCNPVVSILIGFFWGDQITIWVLIGIIGIFSGVYLVGRRQEKSEEA